MLSGPLNIAWVPCAIIRTVWNLSSHQARCSAGVSWMRGLVAEREPESDVISATFKHQAQMMYSRRWCESAGSACMAACGRPRDTAAPEAPPPPPLLAWARPGARRSQGSAGLSDRAPLRETVYGTLVQAGSLQALLFCACAVVTMTSWPRTLAHRQRRALQSYSDICGGIWAQ